MAKCIMIQGTMSNAGKSLITAGLCRVFMQDGYKVAPFKSQNMALNSFITEDGYEMGRAQVVQAEACGVKPDVRMNPILLKPTSDCGSQVIVNGKVHSNMRASEYFAFKRELIPQIMEAYNSLAAENDIIVIEGAGSPAEINLKQEDIVNMGMAKMAKAPVLIAGDIDRGGVFAALYGTYMLQTEEEKKYIKGTIINKFRGDTEILKPGLKMLEDLINVKTVGVIPYAHLDIEDEDSLSDRFYNKSGVGDIDIAVIRLPKISNFTDFNALEHISGANVRYVSTISEFKDPDMVILPGTKNTIADLLWLRQCGLEGEVLKFAARGKPVFGICGGYQMLCKKLSDPYNVEGGGEVAGLALIDAETIFEWEKIRTQVTGEFSEVGGVLKHLSTAKVEGYEIHMGQTNGSITPLVSLDDNGTQKVDGVQYNNIYGTYLHGVFDSDDVLKGIAKSLMEAKGLVYDENTAFDIKAHKEREYNKLADLVRSSLDMDYIYKIMEEGM